MTAARHPLEAIPCAECTAMFVPKEPRIICCKPECTNARRYRKNRERSASRSKPKKKCFCEVCGNAYETHQPDTKYCSDRCKISKLQGKYIAKRSAERARTRESRLKERQTQRERRAEKRGANYCRLEECGKLIVGHSNRTHCDSICKNKARYLKIKDARLARLNAETIARREALGSMQCTHPGCAVVFKRTHHLNTLCDLHSRCGEAGRLKAAREDAPKKDPKYKPFARRLVPCKIDGCEIEFLQTQSNHIFCPEHAQRSHRKKAALGKIQANAAECEALRAVRGAMRHAAELAAESTAATKAAKLPSNNVKACLDRRGLECRKFFGKKCFDVRNLKQCGKTL